MTDSCKKTYTELYAAKWHEDLRKLTDLKNIFEDELVFAIQVALAASETTFATGVVSSFLASLSAEIGASTGAIAAVLGGAADLMLSGVSAASVVSNGAGEIVRRLLSSVSSAVVRVFGPLLAEGAGLILAPILEAIAAIAVPVLAFAATALAAFAAKVGVEALEAYNLQQSADPDLLDIRQSSARPNGVNEGISVESLTVYDTPHTGRKSGVSVRVETLKQYDFEGLSAGIQSTFTDDCAEQVMLSNYGDYFHTGTADLTGYDDWHVFEAQLIIDMSNRVGGNVASADFDTVTYAPTALVGFGGIAGGILGYAGIFWYNGETHAAGSISGGITTALAYLAGPAAAIAVGDALDAESFLPDDDLIVKGAENIILTDQDDRFAFTNNDYTVHSGYGTISGDAGGDILLYDDAKFVAAGAPIDPAMQAAADARKLENAARIARGEAPLPVLPDSPKVLNDLQLRLDGGIGNDWIYASGGEKAVTIGGLGRDWIYNTSNGGIIWGDIEGSRKQADGSQAYWVTQKNALGQDVRVQKTVADDRTNSDNFWYAPDVTIMDAQHSDVLKFYGITLTGGEVGSSAWSLLAGGLSGNMMIAQTVVGGVASAAAAVNIGRQVAGLGPIYYDTWLPFIAYTLVKNDEGGEDLIVFVQGVAA
jgi:hypothetical protein